MFWSLSSCVLRWGWTHRHRYGRSGNGERCKGLNPDDAVEAMRVQPTPYLLHVDEINRADLSTVLETIWNAKKRKRLTSMRSFLLRRSALETVTTEFEIQGLKLDFVGLCLGGDFVWDEKALCVESL